MNVWRSRVKAQLNAQWRFGSLAAGELGEPIGFD
jgi:hypothetical protein